jgi:hypothetical protein
MGNRISNKIYQRQKKTGEIFYRTICTFHRLKYANHRIFNSRIKINNKKEAALKYIHVASLQ